MQAFGLALALTLTLALTSPYPEPCPSPDVVVAHFELEDLPYISPISPLYLPYISPHRM